MKPEKITDMLLFTHKSTNSQKTSGGVTPLQKSIVKFTNKSCPLTPLCIKSDKN